MRHEAPTRLLAIDRQLAQALDLVGDARRAFLRTLAEADAEMAARVAELLDAAEAPDADDQLASLVAGIAARACEDDPDLISSASTASTGKGLLPTDCLGPYRVVREIAKGGMAVVYLGERADGAFEHQVALKVLPLALADDDAGRRLQRERQILADLQHPGIARLLDGGADAWGRPYLVMELVEGTPIDRYCDDHRLDIEARLRLMVEAARAVEFAHRHLVLHRDLKPSNVLVTREGQVKLLDFGIATLLDADGGGPRTAPHMQTQPRTQARLLTPAYASPEQWRGEVLTTASDAYQLGLMLFELLTGQRVSEAPDEVSGVRPLAPPSAVVARLSPDEVSARARDRATTPAAWVRRLRDDLDTITGTLLHPDPTSRYGGRVAAFIEDVARHHAGTPIVARPPTRRYRASRFVRRHRVSVAAALIVLLVLIGGGAAALWQAAAAQRARDRAMVEASRAQHVAEFLMEVFAVSNAERAVGCDTSARDLLDRGVRRVEQELAQEPELQAGMMDVMGEAYHSLGFYDQATVLLDRALAARESQAPRDFDAIATVHQHLGVLMHDRGELDRADRHFTEALILRRRMHGAAHPLVADTLHEMAWLAFCRGQLDESGQLFREVLAMRRQLLGGGHPAVAATLNELGRLALRQRHPQEAESFVRDGLAIRRRALGPRHPTVAASLDMLGMISHTLGQFDEAEQQYREALGIRRQTQGPGHPETLVESNNLASLLYDREDYEAARRLYRETIERGRERLGNRHPLVAQYLFNLSLASQQLLRHAEAERALREAIAIRQEVYGERNVDTAGAITQLATVLHETGALEEARRQFERALRICRTLPAGETLTSLTLLSYGSLLLDLGRVGEAAPMIEEGATLRQQHFGDRSWRGAAARTIVADLRVAQGRPHEALQLWADALPILRHGRPKSRATVHALARWQATVAEVASP
jgi:serine/threonine protein kinase/tetratricopeptide (TPR) repeat protein